MLILTRRKGQKIQVGDEITITVTEIKGQQVRIGIEASPAKYPIYRDEVYQRILLEKTG